MSTYVHPIQPTPPDFHSCDAVWGTGVQLSDCLKAAATLPVGDQELPYRVGGPPGDFVLPLSVSHGEFPEAMNGFSRKAAFGITEGLIGTATSARPLSYYSRGSRSCSDSICICDSTDRLNCTLEYSRDGGVGYSTMRGQGTPNWWLCDFRSRRPRGLCQ